MTRKLYLLWALKYLRIPYGLDRHNNIWIRGVMKQDAVIFEVEGAEKECVRGQPFRFLKPRVLNIMKSEEERSRAEDAILTLLQSLLDSGDVFPRGADGDKGPLPDLPNVM